MGTITITLRIDKLSKNGSAPIHFRIVKGRRSNYISSGIKIPLKYWDQKNKRIKSGFPNSAQMNHLLYTRYKEATKKFLEVEIETKYASVRMIAKEIKGEKVPGFFELADRVLERTKADGKVSTYDLRKAIVDKFQTFTDGKEIDLVDINHTILQTYEL